MLCQNCNKRAATVIYTKTINNKKTEFYLCDVCARENSNIDISQSIGLDDIFASLMGFNQPIVQYVHNKPAQLKCPKCGLTYDVFKKSGKLGCNQCYDVFREKLEPVIKQLHGNVIYKGRVPQKAKKDSEKVDNELEELKKILDNAVKLEEYEEAAKIRDRIRAIENRRK